MKCPKCRRDHRVKAGMKCTCGYDFVFNPKLDGMTDARFKNVVERVSSADTAYFTENQFHAELCRRNKRHPLASGLVFGAAACACAYLLWRLMTGNGSTEMLFFLLIATAIGGVAAWRFYLAFAAPPPNEADKFLKKWHSAGRRIEKLIDKPRLTKPPPEWSEPDIYDYGVERILFVDRDLLVDLFVLNGLHTRERALILSVGGYPNYLVERARQLLKEQQDLPVFFLHDSRPDSGSLLDQISSQYGIKRDRILDVGLFPDDVKNMKRFQHLRPQASQYHVPVDSLPYSRMGEVMAATFVGGVALSVLLEQQQSAAGEVGVSDFG